MRKRMWSMLLCAVMILSLLPVRAQAVPDGYEKLTEDQLGEGLLPEGNYYLDQDLTLTGQKGIWVGTYDENDTGYQVIWLDLNGHTLDVDISLGLNAIGGGVINIRDTKGGGRVTGHPWTVQTPPEGFTDQRKAGELRIHGGDFSDAMFGHIMGKLEIHGGTFSFDPSKNVEDIDQLYRCEHYLFDPECHVQEVTTGEKTVYEVLPNDESSDPDPSEFDHAPVKGEPYVGKTLTVNKGWGVPDGKQTYQWWRVDDENMSHSDATDIKGATGKTYTLTQEDVGKYIGANIFVEDVDGYYPTIFPVGPIRELLVNVSFNGNGGTVATAAKQASVGKTYGALPTAERAGYVFDGWYTQQTGGDKVTETSIVQSPSDHMLYAHWTAQKIDAPLADQTAKPLTIKFDCNAKDAKVSASGKEVAVGDAYGELPTPKRKGYVFQGWFTQKSKGKKVTKTTKAAEGDEQTLYAHWELLKIKVTFDGNAKKAKVKTTGKTVTYGKKYGTLPKAARRGYAFKGWYTKKKGGNKVTKTTLVTQEAGEKQTLYAQWKKK